MGPVSGYAIGTWLSGLRAAAQVPAGEPGALAAERRRALKEIDLWWCPVWPITWQRSFAVARSWWLECDGRVDWTALPESTVFEGEQFGRWVLAQRAGWPGLEEDQWDLLTAIGVEADPELVAAKEAAEAKPKVSRMDRFEQGLMALAACVGREGHVRVPRAHKEVLEAVERPDGSGEMEARVVVALGLWLNNTRARRAKLTPGTGEPVIAFHWVLLADPVMLRGRPAAFRCRVGRRRPGDEGRPVRRGVVPDRPAAAITPVQLEGGGFGTSASKG
ncbi:hypothetical protein [Kitasatospora sp. NBC_00315]|uniref:hypothetical protein n=1 Tax=Kitasatospora sp. NBC_00315 TaxID=2975963 RepID=UPI003243B9EB